MTTDTKTLLLKKAKKLFAQQGFDGVSIRSICDKVDCNVSAISYHFGSKEELYRACLADEGANIIHLIDSILKPVENATDFKVKLKLFLQQFFEYNVNNREVILMLAKDTHSKFVMETVNKIFQGIPDRLTAFFQGAIDKGIVRDDFKADILGDLIIQPYFMHTLFAESSKSFKRRDVMDGQFRAQLIEQQLLLLFHSILK